MGSLERAKCFDVNAASQIRCYVITADCVTMYVHVENLKSAEAPFALPLSAGPSSVDYHSNHPSFLASHYIHR